MQKNILYRGRKSKEVSPGPEINTGEGLGGNDGGKQPNGSMGRIFIYIILALLAAGGYYYFSIN